MIPRVVRVRGTVLLVIGAGVLLLAAPPIGSAQPPPEQLPPALVQQLEDDQREADRELALHRRRLAQAASVQRVHAAEVARLERREALLRSIEELVPGAPELAPHLDPALADARRDLRAVEVRLERATTQASVAQGTALDAERRLRALRRAAATVDERDADLGSYRFGSGGPPVSAASLDRYLQSKASPLAGSGDALLAAGIRYDIDPRLIVAIAGAESYFGIQTCAPHNAWGWGCPTAPFRFSSWAQGIDTVARGLREGYLDDGLTTVGEIHLRYAPPAAANDPTGLNYAWPDNVARFLVEQGGDPQDVAGLVRPSR